ncbi:hypothetical protein P0D88_40700 [Paraburkholderia sp. RL18-103-BIB-C]|uniref:hypothetical protein n=1 Tax=unclassified Paraburkholderia TaxID=2615204 RepID=UPI0038B76788
MQSFKRSLAGSSPGRRRITAELIEFLDSKKQGPDHLRVVERALSREDFARLRINAACQLLKGRFRFNGIHTTAPPVMVLSGGDAQARSPPGLFEEPPVQLEALLVQH